MEWSLSQKEKKFGILLFPLLSTLILGTIIFGSTGVFKNLKDWIIFYTVLGITFSMLDILFYKIGQRVEGWNYPRIVRIENNRMRILLYDLDKREFADRIEPIEFSSIYQIEIRDKFFRMYYERDGKKYFTGFALDSFFIRRIRGEREKRMQILNEVLKRVDKNRVEIIDKRKSKNIKIEGGDR